MKAKTIYKTVLCGMLFLGTGLTVSANIMTRQAGNFYEYNISRFQENNYLPGAKKVSNTQNETFKVTNISVTEELEAWACDRNNNCISDSSFYKQTNAPQTKNLNFNKKQDKGDKVTVGFQNANWSGYNGKVTGWVDYK